MPDPDDIPLIGPYHRALTPEQRSQVPILGEVEGSMNAIIDFYEYGCYPNWTVWVDTLWPCLGKAFLMLFDFGWGDILRGYFRPTYIRGGGGLTRKPVRNRIKKAGKVSKIKALASPPEIGNEIGKALPGSKKFQARKVTGAERLVWILDFQVQKVFWYWLIFAIAEEFIQCWSSSIMKSEACAKPDLGTVAATRNNQGPYAPGSWHAIIGWTTQHNTAGGKWNSLAGTLAVPLGQKVAVTFYGDTIGWAGGLNTGGQIACSPTDGGGTPTNPTPWPVGANDDPRELATTATYEGPVLLHLAVKTYGTGLQGIDGCHFTAHFY